MTLQIFLAGFYLIIQLLKITRGGKKKASRKKRKTTVMATWKLRGLPWLAASIRLSQAAFKLLYLSEKSKGRNSCQVK
jgi:hypothetical protein